MKVILPLIVLLLFVAAGFAQSRAITKSEYDAVFDRAVGETNAAFPFVFTVIVENYEKGKLVSTETDIEERQAAGVERETKSIIKDGKTLRSYSIMVGFGEHTYCSRDGKTWTGPQKYVCRGPDESGLISLYRPRTPESAEYSVSEKSVSGKPVKVYREYLVFASSEPNGKRDFREKIATVDSQGLFIDIIDTEGTLDPRTVTLIRKQSWTPNAKFAPVVAPK